MEYGGIKHNRRAFERKALKLRKKILVNQKREAQLKNISLGGLCFQTAQPMDVGNEITVGNRLMQLYASVLQCIANPSDESGEAGMRHEVRCKYVPTQDLLQEQMLMELVMADDNGGTAA